MKDKILKIIDSDNYKKMSIHQLAEELDATDADRFKELIKTLNELEDEMILGRDQNENYDRLERLGYITGKVLANSRGFAFVEVDETHVKDIFISKDNINGAMHGDRVLVRIHKKQSGASLEGTIDRIIERRVREIVGTYTEKKDVGYLMPDDKRVSQTVMVNKINNKGAMPDHKVKAIVTGYHKDYIEAEIIDIIGHKNDPGIDILSIVHSLEIPTEFPKEVLNHAELIPETISERDLLGRRDLRNDVIVTIDGDDAKDLDDAVKVQVLDNGNYLLGVYIADVSHYVKDGTPIDREALERGTSVYLADRVIPMIPHRLSNGICSLNPQVDRLTVSCEMEIDPTGSVVKYEIFPAVIKTVERMTYNNVNKILIDNEPSVVERYKDLVPMFKDMERLAEILRSRRNNRGAINFETPESKIVVNEEGKPTDIILRERYVAEKLIEEFMLVANETVAEHFHWLNYPFIYRVHEDPKPEKLKNFIKLISALGYKIKGKENKIHPSIFQSLLAEVEGEQTEHVINTMLLRSMAKARYSEQSLGHYGLATEYYTHFTSPIRRYPDTIVHRLIREYVFNAEQITDEKIAYWGARLPEIAEHTSRRERGAIECEREVEDMKKAEYMEDKIGEEYEGVISSITNWGMFIELPNTIEGLVHVSEMNDDYYEYDEKFLMFVGRRTKKTFQIGDKVKVRVTRASKEDREIDFEIIGMEGKKRKRRVVIDEDKTTKDNKDNSRPRSNPRSANRRTDGNNKRKSVVKRPKKR